MFIENVKQEWMDYRKCRWYFRYYDDDWWIITAYL